MKIAAAAANLPPRSHLKSWHPSSNMPPANPWAKKQKQQNSKIGLPALKPINSAEALPGTNIKLHYEELQEEELYALSAIYAEDFRRVEKNHGAWKVLLCCT